MSDLGDVIIDAILELQQLENLSIGDFGLDGLEHRSVVRHWLAAGSGFGHIAKRGIATRSTLTRFHWMTADLFEPVLSHRMRLPKPLKFV